MHQLPVRYYTYGTIGVANHDSDWGMPKFQEDPIVVLDPTVVRDDQAFWPLFVVVGICSAIAVLIKPPTSKQSYHRSINQKTNVCTQKSSTSPGKHYKNAFLSHQVQCCIGDGCVQSAPFVICRMMDMITVISLLRLVGTDTFQRIDHMAL